MKAVVINRNGGIECLEIADLQEPKPGPNEVALEVRAAALNHLDIWVRKGRPGMTLDFPHVLGSDASGIVTEAGSDVEGMAIGDSVLLNPSLSCGMCEYCLRGEQNVCPSFSIMGLGRSGTFAERIVAPAGCIWQKPPYLTYEEAAALPLDHVTAWRMLMTRARLRPGETVLIHGIGGGAALAGLQWAKLAGASVVVTSSSDHKLDKAKQLGADHRINYRQTDVAAAVKDWTSGRGVDVIFDSVGAATWPINLKAIRRGGRIVHCGVTTGAEVTANLSQLYWNQVSVLGSTMGSQEDFRLMLRAAETAKLRPVVDSVHPLDQARDAMARMEAGEQFGKIVLTP